MDRKTLFDSESRKVCPQFWRHRVGCMRAKCSTYIAQGEAGSFFGKQGAERPVGFRILAVHALF